MRAFFPKQAGFVLLGMMFTMVLLAVTAGGINRKAALQDKIGANQAYRTRVSLGQLAAIDHAAWNLKQNPGWRTESEGYDYSGFTFTRKVLNSGIYGYMDAITVSVTSPEGIKPLSRSYRLDYSKSTVFWISDSENSCIRKVDTSGVITTVAGTGISGESGDGGQATAARLNKPNAICRDATGNLYIADTFNNRIRKVDTNGIITTAAGNGSNGFSGDGGQATAATLKNPKGVSTDAAGNLYIADTLNNRIRKVGTNGIITTVAGNGSNGFSGDGGQATAASLKSPESIGLDSAGNLYIADTENNRIRKVDTNGIITTVAGNGSNGFSGDGGQATAASLKNPKGVYLDAAGNLYIADTENNRIRKVDTNGIIRTVAGTGGKGFSGDGGPAADAMLDNPCILGADAGGGLYFADTGNHRIRKTAPGGFIETVAGTGDQGYTGDGGNALEAELHTPLGVCTYQTGTPPEVKPVSALYWRFE